MAYFICFFNAVAILKLWLVYKINRAPFHPSGHEGAVGVFDEGVEQGSGALGVGGKALFPPEDGSVVA